MSDSYGPDDPVMNYEGDEQAYQQSLSALAEAEQQALIAASANPKVKDAATVNPIAAAKAASLLAKPSGRAVGRQHKSIRSYEDDLNPMPEYADDPGLWNQRMRARMHGWLIKKGVKLQANRNTIIAGAFERTHGKPADVRQHFVALYLELRKLRAETAAYKADYRRSPTALRDIATEAHVGDHFARNILGADSMKWDPDKAVALAELRSSSERAVKDGDGQPIAASVKSDWSAAIEAGKKMQAAAEAKQHTMDPEQAQYAIPNHIKRELSLDDKTIGKHVRAAFGKAIDLYINEHGAAKAWATAESYVASQRHPGIGDAGAEPPDEAVRSDNLREVFGRPGITDPKPADTQKVSEKATPRDDKPVSGNGSQAIENKAVVAPESTASKKKPQWEVLTPAPVLAEIKTLTGIPVGRISAWLNRPHRKKSYKEKKNSWGTGTDIDPVKVRQRFDKIFGPQGFGWRIVPIPGIGRITHETRVQKTIDKKTGEILKERTLNVVSYEGFVFEYALTDSSGKITYAQSSAISDSHENDDLGDTYRGAFTSLMKQALKNFGGMDHFIDHDPEEEIAA